MTPEEAFGLVLRREREKQGLSQERLGFESGYHRTYISMLERGLKSPSLSAVFSLSAALSVTPSDLIRAAELLLPAPSDRDEGADCE